MPCLICRYFRPTEPEQHKIEREAGRCEHSCGDKWDMFTGVRYVKNHGGTLDGWCFRYPKAEPVRHSHVCGDVSVLEYFLNHHWRVEPIKVSDNLFEWAQKTLGIVLHDNEDWVAQERARLDVQNVELKRQLKRAREVSASRLKRLQKKKPAEKPAIEPFRPRLVAAE